MFPITECGPRGSEERRIQNVVHLSIGCMFRDIFHLSLFIAAMTKPPWFILLGLDFMAGEEDVSVSKGNEVSACNLGLHGGRKQKTWKE